MERNLEKMISAARAALMLRAPFFGSLLQRAKVIFSKAVKTAAVDGGRGLYINPKWFPTLSPAQQIAVLAHEAWHLAARHVPRSKAVAKEPGEDYIANIAADAVTNYLLAEHGFELPGGAVTMEMVARKLGVDVESLAKSPMEAIYRMLKGVIKIRRIKGLGPVGEPPRGEPGDLPDEIWVVEGEGEGKGGKGGEKRGKGRVVSKVGGDLDGDLRPDLGEGGEEGEDWDRYWKDGIYRAYVTAKLAGNCPAGLKRIVERLLKPKVRLDVLLKDALIKGAGMRVIGTYLRPSRRFPELPGLQRLELRNIWFAVDTSGSISEDELATAVSTVFDVARRLHATCKVVCWDAEAYETFEVRSSTDWRRIPLRGGGGTLIKKALKKLLKEMRPKDAVVIMTDGYIGDVEEAEVQRLFAAVASKASTSVLVTTGADVRLPAGWRQIRAC